MHVITQILDGECEICSYDPIHHINHQENLTQNNDQPEGTHDNIQNTSTSLLSWIVDSFISPLVSSSIDESESDEMMECMKSIHHCSIGSQSTLTPFFNNIHSISTPYSSHNDDNGDNDDGDELGCVLLDLLCPPYSNNHQQCSNNHHHDQSRNDSDDQSNNHHHDQSRNDSDDDEIHYFVELDDQNEDLNQLDNEVKDDDDDNDSVIVRLLRVESEEDCGYYYSTIVPHNI